MNRLVTCVLVTASMMLGIASPSPAMPEDQTGSDLPVGVRSRALIQTSDDFFSKDHEAELIVYRQDWEHMEEKLFDPNEDGEPTLKEMPSTLVIDSQRYSGVGVRFKGNASLSTCMDREAEQLTCHSPSLKLDTNEYKDGQEVFGMTKLNFHAMTRDGSRMREALGYQLFRDAGVAAPRTTYVRLSITLKEWDGQTSTVHTGVFVAVEQVDDRFLERALGQEGNLYKEVWPNKYSKTPYEEALEEDEGLGVAPMVNFATALRHGNEQVIRDRTNAESLITSYALRDQLDHYDSWTIFGTLQLGTDPFINHNYYWYQAPDGRLTLIPWDVDHIWANGEPGQNFYHWQDPRWCEIRRIRGWDGAFERSPDCDALTRVLGSSSHMGAIVDERGSDLRQGLLSDQSLDARINDLDSRLTSLSGVDELNQVGPNGRTVDWPAEVAALRVLAKKPR